MHFQHVLTLLMLQNNALPEAQKPEIATDTRLKWETPGTFRNCGDNATAISFKWTPSSPRIGDTLHLFAHYEPTATFDQAYMESTIYVPDMKEPVYYNNHIAYCKNIYQFLKKIGGLCPFTKGQVYDIENYQLQLSPSLPVPAGEYHVIMKLRESYNGGQEYACLEGTVNIRSD